MVFPGLCSDSAAGMTTANCPAATTYTPTIPNARYAPDDYACPATNPPIAAYNNNPDYLILPFQYDYRTSDTAGLNTSSNLYKTVGAGTGSCGVPTPGGEGTFYAGAIYAARDYLYANHRTNVQDVMIILSDGNASASSTQLAGTVKTDGLAFLQPRLNANRRSPRRPAPRALRTTSRYTQSATVRRQRVAPVGIASPRAGRCREFRPCHCHSISSPYPRL